MLCKEHQHKPKLSLLSLLSLKTKLFAQHLVKGLVNLLVGSIANLLLALLHLGGSVSLGSLLCSLGMSLDGSGIFLDLCLSSLLGSLAGGIGVRSHLGSIGIDGSLGGGSTLLNACGQVGDAVDQISNCLLYTSDAADE